MSEDEGSVDSAADAEEADDAAPVDGAESGEEQGAPADADADDRSTAAGDEGTADATEADGFVTADPEPAGEDASAAGEAHGDASTGAAGERGSTPVSEDIVDRVAAYDDDAAAEVRALVERAFELKGEAERVPELEGQVAELQGRVQELQDRVEARQRRVEELEDEAESLREERDDLKGKLARKQADFKNYKERQKRKQEQMKERATEDLVERLVGVRDNLKRALEQDVDDDESIRGGVEMTLKEFDRVLEAENVEEISPDPGEDVDPQRHEVMVRVDSEYPEGAIEQVFNPGYEMADRVIQAAQVTVSNGAEHSPADDAGDADEDGTAEADATAGAGDGTGEGEAPDEDAAASGDDDAVAGRDDDAAAGGDGDAADVQPEADGSGEGEADAAAGEDDGGEEAVALGGEVDEGTPETGENVDEASDDDISAALDDE